MIVVFVLGVGGCVALFVGALLGRPDIATPGLCAASWSVGYCTAMAHSLDRRRR